LFRAEGIAYSGRPEAVCHGQADSCDGLRKHMVKSADALLPEHEGLRRAVQWLATQRSWDAKTIEEASLRFDLSPLDEEFLLRHFHSAESVSKDTGTVLSVRRRDILSGIGKQDELETTRTFKTRRR
jgi:hypothetical protein